MLLRRIIHNFRRQEWMAIAIDFVIVVVGVFIGIQVSNWNEVRGERALEEQILVALRNDIALTTTHVRELVDDVSEANEHLQILALYADGQSNDLQIRELDRSIHKGVFSLHPFYPNLVTYDELRNSGRLGLIGDRLLREHLQRLASEVDEVKQSDTDVTQVVYLFTDSFLIENWDVRGFAGFPFLDTSEPGLDWLEPLENRRDAREALQTPEFLNLILYRGRMNLRYQQKVKQLERVLAEIDGAIVLRLKKLGHKP